MDNADRLEQWALMHASNFPTKQGGSSSSALASGGNCAAAATDQPRTIQTVARTNKRRKIDLADRLWEKKERGFDWSEWRRENPKGRRRARKDSQKSYQSMWSNSEQPGSLPPPDFDPTTAYHVRHPSITLPAPSCGHT